MNVDNIMHIELGGNFVSRITAHTNQLKLAHLWNRKWEKSDATLQITRKPAIAVFRNLNSDFNGNMTGMYYGILMFLNSGNLYVLRNINETTSCLWG